MSQAKAKRELERKIWMILKLEGQLPSNTSKQGHAEYVQLKRNVQKQVARKYSGFWQFLRDYEVTRQDVLNLLSMEIVWKDMAEVQRDLQKFRRRKR